MRSPLAWQLAATTTPMKPTPAANLLPESTRMFEEAGDAGEAIRKQMQRNANAVAKLGKLLQHTPPRAVITCARGSSDHAATYARYLIETRSGILTSSASPSISSVYATRQDLRHCLFLAISQSGRSPDLLASARAAAAAGATVVAMVNVEDSPLAMLAHYLLPLHAGPEKSVAATKSYLASLAAIAHWVGTWSEDKALLKAMMSLPEQLNLAWTLDWRAGLCVLREASHLYVIGRGLGLGVAQEAALKCKETSGLHAEAFSEAELRHGPQALLAPGFPALLFAQNDETRSGVEALAAELARRGVDVLLAGGLARGVTVLPTLDGHAALQPLLLAQSFYRLANAMAVARGHDPDQPPHLSKVTETR